MATLQDLSPLTSIGEDGDILSDNVLTINHIPVKTSTPVIWDELNHSVGMTTSMLENSSNDILKTSMIETTETNRSLLPPNTYMPGYNEQVSFLDTNDVMSVSESVQQSMPSITPLCTGNQQISFSNPDVKLIQNNSQSTRNIGLYPTQGKQAKGSGTSFHTKCNTPASLLDQRQDLYDAAAPCSRPESQTLQEMQESSLLDKNTLLSGDIPGRVKHKLQKTCDSRGSVKAIPMQAKDTTQGGNVTSHSVVASTQEFDILSPENMELSNNLSMTSGATGFQKDLSASNVFEKNATNWQVEYSDASSIGMHSSLTMDDKGSDSRFDRKSSTTPNLGMCKRPINVMMNSSFSNPLPRTFKQNITSDTFPVINKLIGVSSHSEIQGNNGKPSHLFGSSNNILGLKRDNRIANACQKETNFGTSNNTEPNRKEGSGSRGLSSLTCRRSEQKSSITTQGTCRRPETQPISTTPGICRRPETQPISTTPGICRRPETQPISTTPGICRRPETQPISTTPGICRRPETQPISTTPGICRRPETQPISTTPGICRRPETQPISTTPGICRRPETQPIATTVEACRIPETRPTATAEETNTRPDLKSTTTPGTCRRPETKPTNKTLETCRRPEAKPTTAETCKRPQQKLVTTTPGTCRRLEQKATTPVACKRLQENSTTTSSGMCRRRLSSTISTEDNSFTMETDEEDIGHDNVRNIRQACLTDSSRTDQIYMGVVWQGGKLGLAYYDVENPQIYMMLDTVENDDFSMLKRVLQQILPVCIVISCKQDERLIKTIKNLLPSSLKDDTGDGLHLEPDVIQLLPSIDFSLEICKRRILNLDLPTIPKHYTESERTLFMSSLVPFDNTCMIRAAGGLVKYLDKSRIGVELEDSCVKVPILSLKCFNLEDQMTLDDTAYSSLQIFQKESHPSVYKTGCKNSKEGLSLFGIMNRCRSQVGSRKLRLWFLRPLRDLEVLKQRQNAICFFVNPRHLEVLTTLSDCLKHIKNISRILTRMIESQASVGDWQALYKMTYHAIYIGDVCRIQPRGIHIFRKISEHFTDDLHRIATLISKIVDFEESLNQERFVVKPDVDTELDERKRTYNGLPDFMTKVAKEELNRLSEEVTECNVIYLPQLGYLLAIPKLDSMTSEEDFVIPGLEFVFMSNSMLHYKSASTTELDRLLGDTQCEITDQETSIMHKLQNLILEHSKVLVDAMDLCAELDCLLTLALCAREFNYNKPTLVQESVINIQNGRHPLQEICCSPFVPNDTQSDYESGTIKILTGPNASGKSVYLKQVGLIVFLAHIGSYVPAEQATIGMFDRIFTRVRSLESVSVGLSTFMIDINQMAEGLRNATQSSLVLVDEFGKGTDMVDGLSLLYASILYWNAMGKCCPHVMISTHFHSLIHQQLLPESPNIKYLTMDTIHDGDELYFLYQLKEGHTSSSYANHIAAQAGLPQEIITRGIEVSKLIKENKPVHPVDTPGADVQQKRCETIVNKFLELDLGNDDLQSFLRDFVLPASKGLK